jgi:hypothetical protein
VWAPPVVNWGMRLAVALALCLSVAAAACGRAGSGPADDGLPRSERGEAAVARIVCDRDGTRVLTPKVEAQPDGVHFVIDNRLKADTGYSVEFPDGGGMGENAPKGKSEHVEPFPPGKVRIGCYESREDLDLDYGTLKISEGESGYKSTKLECPSGMAVGGEDGVYARGAKGEKGDPVELVRRRFSEEIESGDVVEVASYPKSREQRTVRVVREGRVVAVVEYFRESGGWLDSGYSACAGF